MKLYLMRHGEAESPQRDPERGLTSRGKVKIEQLAKHLQATDLSFKHVYFSNKKRAQQTAEIMLKIISPDSSVHLHDKIKPEDDPELIISEINHWTEDTLITSHLPFVPNLMTQLTGKDAYLSAISFETGTLVCLEKDNNANWEIKWATSPSEIP